MFKKIQFYIAATVLLVTPSLAWAMTLSDLIKKIVGYLNQALVLLMGVAVVMFVFYIIRYFILPNENRKEAGAYVLYAVVGFFVVLSVWGLVNILSNTVFGSAGNGTAPSLNTIQSLFPGGGGGSSSGGNSQAPMNPGITLPGTVPQ